MSSVSKIDMGEVTRLTRAGRLAEATALLQGRPSGTRDAAADSDDAHPPTIEMSPPSAPGGAWTPFEDGNPKPVGPRPGAASGPDRSGQAQSLMERLSGLGPAAGSIRKRGRAAPVPLLPGARFEERIFSSGAGRRTYKVYVPSSHAGHGAPIVVMLHGCTQDPDDFALGTRMNELAEERAFLVVYPRQDQSANAQKCWNWFNAADQRRGAGEPALIAGIVEQTLAEFSADRTRVYVAGLSAGGAAASVMGATYPDLFAAIGVHSGLACGAAADLPSAFAAMAGQRVAPAGGAGATLPTIVFHGDADRTVSPSNADQVIIQASPSNRLRREVIRGETGGMGYIREVHCDDDGASTLEQWTLIGAGHAWSGGSPSGSYTDPRGPDASREMARFFLLHRKHGPERP
jgi:poly(hydroxyalkanoate) depolymerase family esterase